jgi:acyl dehydratase
MATAESETGIPSWPDPAALRAAVGTDLPPTRWEAVTPETVRRFARLTGDDQPLHGASDGVALGKVVQGALLTALTAGLLAEVYVLPWAHTIYQAGYDSIRFRAPVRAGEAVRLRARPARFKAVGRGRYWLETAVALESAAETDPVMTGTFLSVIVARDPHDT